MPPLSIHWLYHWLLKACTFCTSSNSQWLEKENTTKINNFFNNFKYISFEPFKAVTYYEITTDLLCILFTSVLSIVNCLRTTRQLQEWSATIVFNCDSKFLPLYNIYPFISPFSGFVFCIWVKCSICILRAYLYQASASMLRWCWWYCSRWKQWNCSKMGCNPILEWLHCLQWEQYG